MLQMDMTGTCRVASSSSGSRLTTTAWVKAGTEERVGIIQDYVDPSLTEFIMELVKKYREPRKCDLLVGSCSHRSVHPGRQDSVRLRLLRPC